MQSVWIRVGTMYVLLKLLSSPSSPCRPPPSPSPTVRQLPPPGNCWGASAERRRGPPRHSRLIRGPILGWYCALHQSSVIGYSLRGDQSPQHALPRHVAMCWTRQWPWPESQPFPALQRPSCSRALLARALGKRCSRGRLFLGSYWAEGPGLSG